MLIHSGNTLQAHQHISYSIVVAVTLLKQHFSIQRDHLKKNKFYIKSDQNIHQDASNYTFFQKISRSVACPISCVQLISLFLYEKNHFFIQNAIKIYTKTHPLLHVFKKFSGAITNLIANELL